MAYGNMIKIPEKKSQNTEIINSHFTKDMIDNELMDGWMAMMNEWMNK